jgi:putative SOS response-associated peptidase YedK
MCGRFALNRGLGQLRAHLRVLGVVSNGRTFTPSNNIAPNSVVPVVSNSEIHLMTWGTECLSNTVINARSEHIASRFAGDVSERRCVIPADGYFEWNSAREPFFLRPRAGNLIFFAAFYNKRKEFVILTRAAVREIARIHDRMPIIFSVAQIQEWEGPGWTEMLRTQPPGLVFWPVEKASLRTGFTGEECLRPLGEPSKAQLRLEEAVKSDSREKLRNFLD